MEVCSRDLWCVLLITGRGQSPQTKACPTLSFVVITQSANVMHNRAIDFFTMKTNAKWTGSRQPRWCWGREWCTPPGPPHLPKLES